MTRADEAGTVGRYRWVSRLARGGMAEVFLGVRPGPEGFETPVVIKRLLPELSGQACVKVAVDAGPDAPRECRPARGLERALHARGLRV